MKLEIVAFLFSIGLPNIPLEKPKIEIQAVNAKAYVYTTFKDFNGKPFPSNSMYLVGDSGVVLIDTPWDTSQCQALLDSIEARHHLPVTSCIVTHFHDDRTAGLTYFNKKGIMTWSSYKTDSLCVVHNEARAGFHFERDTLFHLNGIKIQTYYPGAGHAPDNIVLWIDDEKLLYGGCLIKSTASGGLGNLSHADPISWESAIQKVIKKYPEARYIIPGHFSWQDSTSLTHTLHLLKKHNKTE